MMPACKIGSNLVLFKRKIDTNKNTGRGLNAIETLKDAARVVYVGAAMTSRFHQNSSFLGALSELQKLYLNPNRIDKILHKIFQLFKCSIYSPRRIINQCYKM